MSELCELYGTKCFTTMVTERYLLSSQANSACQRLCPSDCDQLIYDTKFDDDG